MNNLQIALLSLLMLTGCSGAIPNLGVNNGELMLCPKTPNCVNSQAADEEHYIEPIHFTGIQQEMYDHLLQILQSEQRTEILKSQNNYIRLEFTSALFRFVDDVEFYFPDKQDGKKMIHVRSASRVGHSDFGANRKRIEKIRSRLRNEKKSIK